MIGEIGCGFCGKICVKGETEVVQSPLDPAALVCKSCILFFKPSLDKKKVEDFAAKYRPDPE
jgi:hypothetical protein